VPGLENGTNLATDGDNGTGGIHVICGARNSMSGVVPNSGAWSRTFTAPVAGTYGVSVRYRLLSQSEFENAESLVIRQTQQAHEEIQDLLAQLRRLQDLQVSIEVRFVTVSDKFFERIGIDFDFNMQGTAPVSDFNSAIKAGTAGSPPRTPSSWIASARATAS
jgi:type II secretory pathway component GspD/PulD (secretin)